MRPRKKQTRRDDRAAEYQKAIKRLARVIAAWVADDGSRSLDEYLTQVAEDLEQLVAAEVAS